ncbi:hypothetical protein GGR52DRAFT_585622 [Hypoxylon sp. FL1284]|nr:hypothetical protein GGR52DRAFT_585622 [Hypoxylon sp. FL1284]
MLSSIGIVDYASLWATYLPMLTLAIPFLQVFITMKRARSGERDRNALARDLSIRTSEVPVHMSAEDLEQDLKSLAEDDTLKEVLHTLVLRSMVQFNKEFACATVTVNTEIPENELLNRVVQASKTLPYRNDLEFYGITPLHDDKICAKVDIIAVPGLAGHAVDSWKSSTNNDIWLRDYLPKDEPNTRVLLYGYDTTLLEIDSRMSIEEMGFFFLEILISFRQGNNTNRRPIIFIGHSLGGLLIKEALVYAQKKYNNSAYRQLFQACSGLLFFGVPNFGLRSEQLETIVEGRPALNLIRDLVVDSDSMPSSYLKRISNDFSNCCQGQYRVVSFYETRLSSILQKQADGTLTKNGPKTLMVTEKSATSTGLTAVRDEDNISFDTDHSGLVKYESRIQGPYTVVRSQLKVLVHDDAPRIIGRDNLTSNQKRSWNNLNDPLYTSFRNSTLAEPDKGTFQWLLLEGKDPDLNEDQFSPPGRGKSVLSKFILQTLEGDNQGDSKIIYYFCNIRNDESSRNARSVLRALIVQLCERDPTLLDLLLQKFTQDHRNFFAASQYTLLHLFQHMLHSGPWTRVYCVIDGLDVYHEGMDDLITGLKTAFSIPSERNGAATNLLCTSRPDHDIAALWDASLCHNNSPRRILYCHQDDIRTFIDKRGKVPGVSFTHQMTDVITKELLSKAGDTFLWIDVAIRRLRSIRLPYLELIKEIKNSSANLHELYDDLVKRATANDDVSALILVWVVYAKRPLRCDELADATIINPKRKIESYEESSKYRSGLTAEVLRSRLGTLLDVVDDKVCPIHESFKDYFMHKDPLQGSFGSISPRLVPAYASMVYLNFDDINDQLFIHGGSDSNGNGNGNNDDRLFPLLQYAVDYWCNHIELMEDIHSNDSLRDLARQMANPTLKKSKLWMVKRSDFYEIPELFSQVAIQFDIAWLAELLLNDDAKEFPNDFQQDCLLDRHLRPRGNVLKALLRHDREMKFMLPEKTVEYFARESDDTLIKLLLQERGDEIKITWALVKTAASNEYDGKGILKLLLEERGKEIKITPDIVQSAVENRGGSKGSPEVMKLLLQERGNEIRITPMISRAAAKSGAISTTRLLLQERGDEIQITPELLEAAARNEHNGKEIIKEFLEERGHEIQIRLPIPMEPSVVEAAAQNPHGEKIMKLFLEKRGHQIRFTPAVVTAASGNPRGEAIVKLLLEERSHEIQMTPAMLVGIVRNQYGEGIMKMLLEERSDEIQITPAVMEVVARSRWGEGIMRLLLKERGYQIQITPTVVEATARSGWGEGIMRVLLKERGYEIYITPAVAEAAAGNWGGAAMMKLLLEERDDEIRITPAVMVAAAENDQGEAIMRLLLEERRSEIQITPGVVGAIERNQDAGEKIKELLREHDFSI